MKKFCCIVVSLLSLAFMNGCSDKETENESVKIPDIVFIYNKDIYYEDNDNSETGDYLVTFWDKNGNYYFTDYNTICELPFDKLIEKFNSGDKRIQYISKTLCTREASEIKNQYEKICSVDGNCKLEYPAEFPAVNADKETWYGLYYNNNGELCSVELHKRMYETDIFSDNDIINEVYEWIES